MPDVKQHFNQHRQHGLATGHQADMEPIKRGDTRASRLITIALAIAFVLYGYGIAATWDAQAEAENRLIDQQLQYAAERGNLERETAQRVSDAYAQGLRDAMRGMTERQGLEFAQACRAYQLRDIESDYLRPSVATTKKGA